MKIKLLWIAKTADKYLEEGISIYAGRLKHYCRFETQTLPDIKKCQEPEQKRNMKEKEGKLILETLGQGGYFGTVGRKR
ncbi:23S rRNA (pseudouridine(1915)-N(3))-methyltransferase RlmH [Oscillatoria amoena NRMC-F 0135]|nr:23S rRNA (pseudouridine(1915)-N(3))-methyltransferase RlmH [Oscillatoria amoena NRMC-F 0135]